MTKRGQSEILGYVIVFSIIAASVGFIYVTGFPALENSQEAMATNNVETAFDVMDDNVRDITQEGAPSRATEVRIAGGRLFVGEPTQINVSVENMTHPDDNVSISSDTWPVIYQDEAGRTVTYVSGAIIRGNGSESVMADGPNWELGDGRTIMPLQIMTPRGQPRGISGETTVLLVNKLHVRAYTQTLNARGHGAEVNITVTSDRWSAWEEYFLEANRSHGKGIEVVAEPDAKTVYWRFETAEFYTTQKAITVEMSA